MPKINDIKRSVKTILEDVGVPVYTERKVNRPPSTYATVHLSEWERSDVVSGQGFKMTGTLVIEYFASSDGEAEAMSERGLDLLSLASPPPEHLIYIGFEEAEFTDTATGSALAQRWTIHFYHQQEGT